MYPKYVVSVDLDLPPLHSGLTPTCVFSQFIHKDGDLFDEFVVSMKRLWMLLKWARSCAVMVLDSVSGRFQPDLLACVLMLFYSKRPVVIMTSDMWHRGGTLKYLFQKMIVKLADFSIDRYAVHSKEEGKIFAELWGVAPEKVRVCIYNYTFTDEEINAGEIKTNGYIFAGGNPSRDYDMLLETARQLKHRKFIIATRMLNGRNDIPENVKVVKVSHMEFINLMRESDMVVTPLVSGMTKSSGQQTYLNAMRLGKISIVNGANVLGVTDYVQNYVNGIITDSTSKGISDAIEWTYASENSEAVNKMKKMAQEMVIEFSYARYLQTMSTIIEEAVAEAKTVSA